MTTTDLGFSSGPYVPLQQFDAKGNSTASVFHVNDEHTPAGKGNKRATWSIIHLCSLVAIGLMPIISMIVWGGLNANQPDGWTVFSSRPIGGRFTQPQAKAIDLVCSAVLAPLLLVIFNYVWFTSARVAAVNELDKKPTSLHTLAIVSSSATGSYNFFDIWHLVVKSRATRLTLFGILILAAAIANTALTNVIAYEAYSIPTISSGVQLRYLWDDQVQEPKFVDASIPVLYEFNSQQTSLFSKEFTGVLTGLSIQNARSLLNGTEYYLVNATSASLDALKGNVVDLPKIPAIKYGVSCEAATPNNPSVIQMGDAKVSISETFNKTDRLPSTLVNAYYPGQIETLQSGTNEQYNFLGFPVGLSINESTMGFLTSFDLTNDTVDTSFGTIRPAAVDMTAMGFNQTKATMSWWGMRCWMTETPGTVDLHRAPNASWTTSKFEWDVVPAKVTTDWLLSDLQLALDYSAPGSTLPGIGPALAALVNASDSSAASPPASIDYETTALNLLYAECEAKRLIYETAAMNTSRSRPEYFYKTEASQQTQFYRIIYVPFILFAGELAILLATGICLGFALWTWRSTSGKSLRKVDVLRFVVDSVAGLQKDDAFSTARYRSNPQVDNWADSYFVRYRMTRDQDTGVAGVTLAPASRRD